MITRGEIIAAKIREEFYKCAREFNIALEDVSIGSFMVLFLGEATKLFLFLKKDACDNCLGIYKRCRTKPNCPARSRARQVCGERAEGDSQPAEMMSTALAKAVDGPIASEVEASKEIAQTLAHAHNIAYLPSSKNGNGSNMLVISVPLKYVHIK